MRLNESIPLNHFLSIINKELEKDLTIPSLLSIFSALEVLKTNFPNQTSIIQSKIIRTEKKILSKKNGPISKTNRIAEELYILITLAELNLI